MNRMPNRRKISPLQRQNIGNYRIAKRAGWKLFKEAKLAPWERKLLAKALTVALRTHLGIARKSNESAISVKIIIPFAANGLKAAIRERIPEDQRQIFCKLMNWYAANPREFHPFSPPVPEKIKALATNLSQVSFIKIYSSMGKSFFRVEEKERPSTRSAPDFQKDIEFYLKHDIAHSLFFIFRFLQACEGQA